MSVETILNELKDSILTEGSIETVGEIYQRLESASVAYPVSIVAKPLVMQMMRKYLMKQMTSEMMRVSTNTNPIELSEYDIVAEIDLMLDAITVNQAAIAAVKSKK